MPLLWRKEMRKGAILILTMLMSTALSSCFLAANSYDGGYQCSWWHLHKHPGQAEFCKQRIKERRMALENTPPPARILP